jgi:hypothetical protein
MEKEFQARMRKTASTRKENRKTKAEMLKTRQVAKIPR